MLSPIQSPALAALPHIAHGFFTRSGGVSAGFYGSLNCGIGSNDIRANVMENRRRVATHLRARGALLSSTSANEVLTAYQVHSANAVLVDRPWTPETQPKADALVTRKPGVVLGVLTADCAPVLFTDPGAGVIAAAHAGWRGALGGIVEATLDVMEQAGARRTHVIAAVGPCIGPAAYEIGPEFQTTFLAADPSYARHFTEAAAGAEPGTRSHFDLPGFVAERLHGAGVGRVDMAAACTYTDPDRFFSFRRTTHARAPDYGRQISALVLL